MNPGLSGDVSLNAPIREDGDSGEWVDWLIDGRADEESRLPNTLEGRLRNKASRARRLIAENAAHCLVITAVGRSDEVVPRCPIDFITRPSSGEWNSNWNDLATDCRGYSKRSVWSRKTGRWFGLYTDSNQRKAQCYE